MTLIVGVGGYAGGAVIAADHRYTDEQKCVLECTTPKIVRFAQDGSCGSVLFGMAGSSRVLQAVRAESLRMARGGARLPADDGYGLADWATAVFVPWLYRVLDEADGPVLDNVFDDANFDGVLARKDDVVEIDTHLAVHAPISGNVAIGIAMQVAYGSLETTAYMDLDTMGCAGGPAVVRARAAMEAAAQVSAHVGGEYTVSYVDPGVPDDLYSTDRTSVLRSLRMGGKTE